METIGQRIQRLMEAQRPPWNRPRLRSELKKHGLDLTVESIRQYTVGMIQPGREVRAALAKAFRVSEGYIEFGDVAPAVQQPLQLYSVEPTLQSRLLAAFDSLLPDQQLKFLGEMEAMVQTNQVFAQRLVSKLQYKPDEEVAKRIQPAPPLLEPQKVDKTKKKQKKP